MPINFLVRRRIGNHTIPAQMPVISRNVPVYDSGGFGGTYANTNANDAAYGTTWRSVNVPSTGSPQWLAYDLRGVSSASKTNVWCVWWNYTNPARYAGTPPTLGSTAGSAYQAMARNYTLDYHTSSGSLPAAGDVGWTTLTTVTDNSSANAIHTGLNLSSANWFRIKVTASSGVTGATDDLILEMDLRDVSAGHDDSILVYGDSISMEGFNLLLPGNTQFINGPLMSVLESFTGRPAPVIVEAATGGWLAETGDTNKAALVGWFPGKYVMLNFGTNNANSMVADFTAQGQSDANVISYKNAMLSMVDYVIALGKIPIIPLIPWGNADTYTTGNVGVLNQTIRAIYTARPTVIQGPDLYSFFSAHQNLIRDGLHPTYDATGGLLNGMNGYENMLVLWRDNLKANLY